MIISNIYKEKKTVFSLEVFPPKKTYSEDIIYNTIDGLKGLSPDFISVTYGAGGNVADVKTRAIAEIVKKKYGIESMAHLTCVSTAKNDAEEILRDLESHGIENILALRGDINPDHPPKNGFRYASDLARFIRDHGGFDIGGACYPETHTESASSEEDIKNLKFKTECGATFLISQLFFKNSFFYSFIEKIRKASICVPVSAGIMPVTNKKQIERMVTMCGASIPHRLAKILSKYAEDPVSLTDAGVDYASRQIRDLIENGVQGIHLYTMNNPDIAKRIYSNIKDLL